MLAINWDDVIGVIQSISTHLIVGVIAIIVGIIAIVAVKGLKKPLKRLVRGEVLVAMVLVIVVIAKIELKDYLHFIKIPLTFLIISIIMILLNFSHNKENYFSGNIVNLEKGNVKVIAETLSTMIDTDIYEIKEVDAYPFDYHECTSRASEELKNNACPQILDPLESIDEYDTIYLGYPNW